jgi:hypothetical protein
MTTPTNSHKAWTDKGDPVRTGRQPSEDLPAPGLL